jgi:hypothetical protein
MTKTNAKWIWLLSGAALILSGCGSYQNTVSKADFEIALNNHYAKVKQCLVIGEEPNAEGIIQEFKTGDTAQNTQLSFYNGMTNLGLLDAVTYQKDKRNFSGEVSGKSDWIGFKFSDEGKKYLKVSDDRLGSGAPQLCYGIPQVVEITGFTEPAESMGIKVSNVQYTYKLVDIASWATEPVVMGQYPMLSQQLANKSIEKDDDMVLTSEGWVHHSMIQ